MKLRTGKASDILQPPTKNELNSSNLGKKEN
jgi:hypothetical protein